jgi:hypothetical protein
MLRPYHQRGAAKYAQPGKISITKSMKLRIRNINFEILRFLRALRGEQIFVLVKSRFHNRRAIT